MIAKEVKEIVDSIITEHGEEIEFKLEDGSDFHLALHGIEIKIKKTEA